MIHINKDLCIRCSLCAWDCFPGAIEVKETAVLSNPESCINCGHCIAICPQNAISSDYPEAPSPAVKEIDPQQLLGIMQSRRSCRHYRDEAIEEEKLRMVIDAARACPTAKNLQGTRYIIVSEKKQELLGLALQKLGAMGKAQLETATDPGEIRRANNFVLWSEEHSKNPNFDPLFFHAPNLLLFVTEKPEVRDAAAAASNAELMAAALGLGCLYSGYFTACCDLSPELRNELGLKKNERVVRCLVMGHPNVSYLRTAPRKNPDITYL